VVPSGVSINSTDCVILLDKFLRNIIYYHVSIENNLKLFSLTTVSCICGIYTSTLHSEKPFSEVFLKFVNWIRNCVQEVEQQAGSYHPIISITS